MDAERLNRSARDLRHGQGGLKVGEEHGVTYKEKLVLLWSFLYLPSLRASINYPSSLFSLRTKVICSVFITRLLLLLTDAFCLYLRGPRGNCGSCTGTLPQLIDLAGVDAAPDPVLVSAPIDVTSDPVEKRDVGLVERDGTCAPQPAGSGPVPTPDTAAAFTSSAELAVSIHSPV